jgi:hypothetical protein
MDPREGKELQVSSKRSRMRKESISNKQPCCNSRRARFKGGGEGKSQGTLGRRWEVVVFKSNIFTAAITTKKTFAFRSHNPTHCVAKSSHSVPYQQVRSTFKRLQRLPIPKSINLRSSSSNGRLTNNSSLR